jgi:hypothetical protein
MQQFLKTRQIFSFARVFIFACIFASFTGDLSAQVTYPDNSRSVGVFAHGIVHAGTPYHIRVVGQERVAVRSAAGQLLYTITGNVMRDAAGAVVLRQHGDTYRTPQGVQIAQIRSGKLWVRNRFVGNCSEYNSKQLFLLAYLLSQ